MAYAGINEVSVGSGQSRSAYANLLKFFYGPKWDSWIHSEAIIADKIGKKKGTMGGTSKVNALTLSLPQSAGMSGGEGYYLPEPTTGTHVNPRIVARDMYTRLRWTGQAQRAARGGDKAAWARPKQSDVEDARTQSTLNFARKLYLGYYDVLGVVSSYSSPTVTLAGREDRTSGSSTATNYYKFGAHYLRENMIISTLKDTVGPGGVPAYNNNTSANMAKISGVGGTLAAPTATMGTSAVVSGGSALASFWTGGDTPAVGDLVIPYASRQDAASYTADGTFDTNFFTFNGIGSVILPSSHYSHLYGLSKATYSKLGGIFDHGSESVREMKEMRLTYLVHRIRNEGSGGSPNVAMLHDSVMREIIKVNEDNRRFAPVQQGKSGYGQMVHMAGSTLLPYTEDWLCPPKQVVALDTTQWGWYSESDMAPLDDPQVRFIPNYDQTEQVWHKSGNIECRKPHNNGILDDLEGELDALPDAGAVDGSG